MYLGEQLLAARLVEMVEDVLNLTLVLVLMDGQGTTVAKVSFPTVIFFHYTLTLTLNSRSAGLSLM